MKKSRREFVKTMVALTPALATGESGLIAGACKTNISGKLFKAVNVPENSTVIFSPAEEEIIEAFSSPLIRFEVVQETGNGGTLSSSVKEHSATHTPIIKALAAYSGNNRLYRCNVSDNCTPAQRTIAQLRYWAHPDEQNSPGAIGGYIAQYELCFAATVAIARLTPYVWNALTEDEINRLDLCMKGCMVNCCFVISDNVPYTSDWGGVGIATGRRTIRGYSAGRFVAPNYSTPAKLMPHVVAFYLGADGTDGPAAARAFLNNFDRNTFAAQIKAAGGLKDLYDTFCQTWTRDVQDLAFPAYGNYKAGAGPTGDGPTAEQLKAALTGNSTGTFRALNRTLNMAAETLGAEIRNYFSRPIVPGVTGLKGNENTPLPGAETSGVPGDTILRGLKGDYTRGVLRAVLMNKADWAGLPNQGQPHMALELWTSDGGFAIGPKSLEGPHLRSAMSYCHNGLSALMSGAVALSVQGAVSGNDPGIPETREKMAMGILDLQYRDEKGYRSYSKGGNPVGYRNTNNDDWILDTKIKRESHKVLTRYAMYRIFNAWLGATIK